MGITTAEKISRHVEAKPKNSDARSGGCFKNAYELVNLGALKSSLLNKLHIFQSMGKIFCVEFQMVPLKFHTIYFTHSLKYMIFIQC